MILTKELIAKGLVGTTLVVAPTTLGIVYRKEIGQALSSSNTQQADAGASNNDAAINALLESAGLSCDDTNGCSLKSGKTINVKHDNNNKKEGVNSISTTNGAKIKVQKNVTEGSYTQNLKLTIEGGNITLTGGTDSGTPTITQLEEFETYEIVSEADKHYLSRKKTANEEKKRILGLPEDAACTLPTDTTTPTTCSDINADKLKKINFDGKGEGDVTVDGGTPSITLKITKTSDNTTYPNGGYKFVFETTQNNITIPKSGGDNIYIKKGTNTEFKIKKEGTSLSLEKAWNITNLAGKIGLTGCAGETDATKECTFGSTINVFNSASEYVTEANVADNTSKKITFAIDTEEFNQGYKFTVSSSDISVTNGSGQGTISSIAATDYEIKEQTVNNETKWFLSKKST